MPHTRCGGIRVIIPGAVALVTGHHRCRVAGAVFTGMTRYAHWGSRVRPGFRLHGPGRAHVKCHARTRAVRIPGAARAGLTSASRHHKAYPENNNQRGTLQHSSLPAPLPHSLRISDGLLRRSYSIPKGMSPRCSRGSLRLGLCHGTRGAHPQ